MNNSVGKVIRYTPLSSDQQIRKENYVTNKYERVCSTLLKLQLGSKFKSLCDVHLNAHYLYAHCAHCFALEADEDIETWEGLSWSSRLLNEGCTSDPVTGVTLAM